ncbi:O-succinylbenzoate synthase [Leifsonia xyli subsp. cynodontis DSM 46306]|uniref:DUF3168 domain-containing protein n=1 Tax=Leifsonia xyli subsp. cynodontis DSM 46306 TaxID=1389489 RepID=U3PBY0_LEIXC|nr:hypothetical protein [Leifsonia xyli]AGW41739.1 O-succinylbenzoate synthase [Leifsonia xyli subsp. cynodontis DSM 46306]AGW42262.1 O-succinylbenzoate synthase [Leifsonia xyli subsp. cynodontis DSM 46306]
MEAARALVEQVPILTGATFISKAPEDPANPDRMQPLPYALMHPIGGTPTAERETGPAVTEHPSITLHLVGSSAEQVIALTDLLRPVLTPETVPVVAGRLNGRVWWREPLPVQEDTDVSPSLIYAVIEFGWRSDPA